MYALQSSALGVRALALATILLSQISAVPVNWRYDCYDPKAGTPRLSFADCRGAITMFLKEHVKQRYELVKREVRSDNELECPYHVLNYGCALELDLLPDKVVGPVPVGRADVENFGNILARECTRIHTGFDGGELFGFDETGNVMLKLLHSSDIGPLHQFRSFDLSNVTERL